MSSSNPAAKTSATTSLVPIGVSPLGERAGSCAEAREIWSNRCFEQVDLEVEVEPQRPRQLERALQQRACGSHIAAPECTLSRGGQMPGGALRERSVAKSELVPVAARLLEVVAEDFLEALSTRSPARASSQPAYALVQPARVAASTLPLYAASRTRACLKRKAASSTNIAWAGRISSREARPSTAGRTSSLRRESA